jgi:O-antigen/teichoic acid export membrane protein
VSFKKSVLANYVGASFAAIAPILALPWYLAALGPKQWGLVSFVSLLQAIMGLLDAGLAQALTREFAIRIVESKAHNRRAAALLFGFEKLYWASAMLLALAVTLLAKVIATNWLNLDGLPQSDGYLAIYGAAAIFAVQFPGSLYRSVLVGGQFQVGLNILTILAILFRYGGGVAAVSIWPSLEVYLAWHVVAALLETIGRALFAWERLGVSRNGLRWQTDEIRQVIPFGVGMSGAVLLGLLNVHIDKIFVSKMLSVEQFGYYAIASSVALSALQLINPVVQAALPRVVELRNTPQALRLFNLKLTGLIVILVGVAGIVFLLLGKPLLEFWLRNPSVAAVVYSPLVILLFGSGLNALSSVGYVNWVAKGLTKRVAGRNGVALAVSAIVIPYAVNAYGMSGAALSWIMVNALGVLLSLDWLRKIPQTYRFHQ